MAIAAATAALVVVLLGVAFWLIQRGRDEEVQGASPISLAAATSAAAPTVKPAAKPAAKAEPAAKPAAKPAKAEPAKPVAKAEPAAKPAPAAPVKLPLEDEDGDEGDLTLVTLRPALGDLPALSSSDRFDDYEEEEERAPVERAAAVPIVFDDDASIDEPTKANVLILVSAVGQTDRGQRRKKNEDSYAIVEASNLFVVADGMGGHMGGEVASSIATETIAKAFEGDAFVGEPYTNVPKRGSDLARSIQMANGAIWDHARANPALEGMGTTVVAALFSPSKERLYIGHVGDSRCYRLRDGELAQLTTDHTMGAAGITGPLADHLERAVGIGPTVKIDIVIGRPRPGDRYMLCSDGLTKMVPADAIREILVADADPRSTTKALVDRANASGGRDNITVIVVEVKSAGAS